MNQITRALPAIWRTIVRRIVCHIWYFAWAILHQANFSSSSLIMESFFILAIHWSPESQNTNVIWYYTEFARHEIIFLKNYTFPSRLRAIGWLRPGDLIADKLYRRDKFPPGLKWRAFSLCRFVSPLNSEILTLSVAIWLARCLQDEKNFVLQVDRSRLRTIWWLRPGDLILGKFYQRDRFLHGLKWRLFWLFKIRLCAKSWKINIICYYLTF